MAVDVLEQLGVWPDAAERKSGSRRADKRALRFHAFAIPGMERFILRRPFLNTA